MQNLLFPQKGCLLSGSELPRKSQRHHHDCLFLCLQPGAKRGHAHLGVNSLLVVNKGINCIFSADYIQGWFNRVQSSRTNKAGMDGKIRKIQTRVDKLYLDA